MPRTINVDKKKTLLKHKEKLIEELKYFEKRIEEAKLIETNNLEYDGSSDSDSDLSTPFEIGPSLTELKIQKSALHTCLNATQELTGVQVLQSEVNVSVEDPVIEGEPPVTEDGIWREVTVECRVDLVPFSMIFYVHQPSRRFGPPSYRCLQVSAVKKAHESELNKSILVQLTTPSDALEVFKSYAAAHRSRRTSLARLAERYGELLHMMPLAEGGYQLKCANLLEMSWTLQNKTSSVAPFHHSMKFDLEYMDESYIKKITQAHKQLSDPSLETDERTLLLSKIIGTCLEAKGVDCSAQESTESESETMRVQKRRTSLDQEPENPVSKKKKEDQEVMAPPKTLPRKIKPKGKENNVENSLVSKTAKGSNSETANDGRDKAKKLKNFENVYKGNKEVDKTTKVSDIIPKEINKERNRINIAEGAKCNKKYGLADGMTTVRKDKENTEKPEEPEKLREGNNKNIEKGKKTVAVKKNIPHKTLDKNARSEKSKPTETQNKVANTKNAKTAKEASNDNERKQIVDKCTKNASDNVNSTDKNIETVATYNKSKPIKHNIVSKAKENGNNRLYINNYKTKLIKDVVVEKTNHNYNKVNKDKETIEINKQHKVSGNTKAAPKLSQNPENRQSQSITKSMNSRFLYAPNIDRRNIMNLQRSTKIPQKNSVSAEKIMKKNPLRITSRNSVSKFSTMSSQESVRSALSDTRKANTNIPRLVKKPITKTKS